MATSERQAKLRELLSCIGSQFDRSPEGKVQPYSYGYPYPDPPSIEAKVIPAGHDPRKIHLETNQYSKKEPFTTCVKISTAENKTQDEKTKPDLVEAEAGEIEEDWVLLMNTA